MIRWTTLFTLFVLLNSTCPFALCANETEANLPRDASASLESIGEAKKGSDDQSSLNVKKTAYFSSGRVSAALPSQRRRQLLKAQAESQLRQVAKESVDVLQKMHSEGRSAAEISAEENRRKVLVDTQQKALAELVGKTLAEGRAEIEEAVASVASAKGLSLVLDLDGIFYGGEDIKKGGRDITADIIQKLNQ